MTLRRWEGGIVLSLFTAAALILEGCNKVDTEGKVENRPDTRAKAEKKEEKGNTGESKHSYAGRDWCAEHGVPESECAQCNDSLAVKFKEKGDWCKEHDRPESQCFICQPDLKAKFAAVYKAKYGEDPPPLEDETPKEESKKDAKK